MINNRQAGRRRGRGGNNNNGPRPNGGGGGQRDSGNRIDSRARGNANQLYEKYKNLAADSQRQGDRVTTEYYLQFADHYFRVLSESRSRMDEQNQRRNEQFDARPFTGSFDTGFDGQDDEYADEGEPIRAGEQAFADDRGGAAEEGAQRNGNGADRNDRPNGMANGQQPRNDRPRESRPRDDRPRDDRPRDDRPRDQRRDEQGGEGVSREIAREDGPREYGPRDQGPRDQGPRDQGPREQGARDGSEGRRPRRHRDDDVRTPQDAEPVVTTAPPVAEDAPAIEAEAPRRRGRPRRERPADEAPATLDAAVLPPSLGTTAATSEAAAEPEEKPRRRRVRAAAVEAPAAE